MRPKEPKTMPDDHPMAAGTCEEHNLWSNPAPITPELAARLQRLAEALEDLHLTPEQVRALRTMAEESARKWRERCSGSGR